MSEKWSDGDVCGACLIAAIGASLLTIVLGLPLGSAILNNIWRDEAVVHGAAKYAVDGKTVKFKWNDEIRGEGNGR